MHFLSKSLLTGFARFSAVVSQYRKLNVLKQQFPTVPILAVTATASQKVVADCQSILGMRGCQNFRCSFNRPNLHFSVHEKSGTTKAVAQDMVRFITSIGHLDSSGIGEFFFFIIASKLIASSREYALLAAALVLAHMLLCSLWLCFLQSIATRRKIRWKYVARCKI